MKKFIYILLFLFLTTPSFASDDNNIDSTDLEYRISRLEAQVRELERESQNQMWQIEDLKSRVRRLEWKSNESEI